MTIDGLFSDAPDSLFNGDYHFEVAYSQNVGTLVFSGDGHDKPIEVYVITQNSNWNKLASSDKYLTPFKNPGSRSDYYGNGVVELADKIYLVGGYSGMVYSGSEQSVTHIQTIDFTKVENLQDAQSRQWIFMQNLKNAVYRPAVIQFVQDFFF